MFYHRSNICFPASCIRFCVIPELSLSLHQDHSIMWLLLVWLIYSFWTFSFIYRHLVHGSGQSLLHVSLLLYHLSKTCEVLKVIFSSQHCILKGGCSHCSLIGVFCCSRVAEICCAWLSSLFPVSPQLLLASWLVISLQYYFLELIFKVFLVY